MKFMAVFCAVIATACVAAATGLSDDAGAYAFMASLCAGGAGYFLADRD